MIAAALKAIAVGRIALGGTALVSPRWAARAFGMSEAISPELEYMSRIFGGRAIALGCGYLTSVGGERRRWQRLGLLADVTDTITGVGHLRRRDLPGHSAELLTALTGTYAAIGAAKLAAEALRRSSAEGGPLPSP